MISIIIPTLNEEQQIKKLIPYLRSDSSCHLIQEIIVVDAHSSDRTTQVAADLGANVVKSSQKSRSIQMNKGAGFARGSVLYFLHADTYPPNGFGKMIVDAVQDGNTFGCFRLRFDWKHWFLEANCWFTRFRTRFFRFGDQSLFVTKTAFQRISGFNECLRMFEDQEIISRLHHEGSFKLLPGTVVTSARKYRQNGPYRLQLVYFTLYLLYALGFKQEFLMRTYRELVSFPRV
ncbi:MAG: glycosyl hydrolase [Cyclobacteriaceae bacterium]|nr:MAG: glycosyl hydrolase [Cyclobacteriaceae bacterium]